MTKRASSAPSVPTASADDLHAAALARRQARMAGTVTSPSQAAPVPAPSDEVSERVGAVPPAAPARLIPATYPVAGMTCRTCEVRIERHVGRLPGVEQVSASAVRGRVEVHSRTPLDRAQVAAALAKAGYELGTSPWLERDRSAWITAGAGVLLIAVFAVLAQVTGLAGLASGATDIGRGGVAIALLLGLAAGVSTCMALVGGIVLALSAAHESARAAAADGVPAGILTRMRPALTFMAGRILGYAVLGAALGAIGGSVTLPPQLVAGLMIVVAVVMTLVGTRLTGLSPRVAAWSPALPPSLAARLGMREGGVTAYSDGRALGLGAASFFMPCGFTQAVQVYALSTGSPMVAGMTMAAFALGTAPGLLALAGLPVVLPSRARPTVLRLVGVVVVGFALLNLSAGLRLAGVPIPGFGTVAAADTVTPGVALTADGTQTLVTQQVADGYTPATATVYAGAPVHWTIQSQTTASCAASLVIPDLNVFRRLTLGDNSVDLPAMPAGTTLRYSCAMGMYGGEIHVVAAPAPAATSSTTGG